MCACSMKCQYTCTFIAIDLGIQVNWASPKFSLLSNKICLHKKTWSIECDRNRRLNGSPLTGLPSGELVNHEKIFVEYFVWK